MASKKETNRSSFGVMTGFSALWSFQFCHWPTNVSTIYTLVYETWAYFNHTWLTTMHIISIRLPMLNKTQARRQIISCLCDFLLLIVISCVPQGVGDRCCYLFFIGLVCVHRLLEIQIIFFKGDIRTHPDMYEWFVRTQNRVRCGAQRFRKVPVQPKVGWVS